MQFIIKARLAYAETFREVFGLMEATFTESPVGDCGEIIAFDVECVPENMHILAKRVPMEAFANIGISGS